MPKIKILSCVGKRPLAVVIPIYTLLKSERFPIDEVEIVLICTKETLQNEGQRCREWFIKKFPEINIPAPVVFDNKCSFLNNRVRANDSVYFNANPAMNWAISLLCLYLPKQTTLISSDNDYCYIWKLTDDAKTIKEIKLENIGINTLVELSNKISVAQKKSMSKHLSPQIKGCLQAISKDKSFVIKRSDIASNILERINQRLIWVKEIKGRLYLLFDMMNKTETASLLDDFRLITAVFDPINYTVIVVSSNRNLIQRARVEAVDFIEASQNTVWHSDIKDWIDGKWETKPKTIIPDNDPFNSSVSTSTPSNIKKTLCVCLGDNIEPTLKAILSLYEYEIDTVSLFYDETSPKISLLAKNVAKLYKFKNIHISLIPTDHKGSGIVEKINELKHKKIQCIINVTPGTKMQSIALSSAAIGIDCKNEVYSIYRDSSAKTETIRRVIDSKDLAAVVPPEIKDLLNCFIIPLKYDEATAQENKDIMSNSIWGYFLDEIASGRMQAFDSLKNSCDYNKQYNIQLHGNTLKLNGKTHQLNKSFTGGTWWEAVVGYAVCTALNDQIYWQATWDWLDGSGQYAEIDVVAKYKNHILAISCKTMKKNLANSAYMIKSEAAKRFGRFAIPLVAIPHEENKGKKIGGSLIDGVAILTPSILNNPYSLRTCLDKVLSEPSTTSKLAR